MHVGMVGKGLIPARLGSRDDVRRNVRDVVVGQAAAERRHGIFAVGDLLDHGSRVGATVQVLLESLHQGRGQGEWGRGRWGRERARVAQHLCADGRRDAE
jgi:hypothetical protein